MRHDDSGLPPCMPPLGSWHAGSSSSSSSSGGSGSGGDILFQLITGRSTLAAATACVN